MRNQRQTEPETLRPARLLLRAVAVAGIGVVAVSALLAPTAAAQNQVVNREAKLKAAYCFQFIKYTQWPPQAFKNDQAPLVIGTVGEDQVNAILRQIAAKRMAGKRKLVYRRIRNAADAKSCHLLFISDKADKKLVAAVLKAIRGLPVLSVGETPKFAARKGVIGFQVVANRVKLQICVKRAAELKLKLSSQLLRLAEIVEPEKDPDADSEDADKKKDEGHLSADAKSGGPK